MNSVKSSALELTRSELRGLGPGQAILRLLPVYGLPVIMALLAVLFSVLLPEMFPTMLNLRSVISDKGVIALLALAAMVP